MAYNILVVDDEADIRELVSGILEDSGYKPNVAGSYIEASEMIKKLPPNLVLLDVWLRDGEREGMRLLELVKKNYEYIPVIMMSGHGTIQTAVTAIQLGAYDFIEKPFDSARLLTSITKAIETNQLQMENADLKVKARVSDGIIGKSPNAQNVRNLINRVASLNGRCIILGTTGSDKETVAKAIHKLSSRSKAPFCAINCQAYGLRQLEIEVFGTEVGNFDDKTIKNSLLEKANGGTLFIDELVYTSLEFQQKLLSVLKKDSFNRIGSSESIPLDVRIIAGLPLDIENLIKDREFSEELYYRLNANVIKILPLVDRKEDIPYLIEYYVGQAVKSHNMRPKRFSSDVVIFLKTLSWNGDVLQLKNTVDWILTFVDATNKEKTLIELEDLPQDIIEGKMNPEGNASSIISISKNVNRNFDEQANDDIQTQQTPDNNDLCISVHSELSIKEAREMFEKAYFIEQLKKFDGNISQVAKFVDMERSALHRKLKALGIADSKAFKKINGAL